MSYNIINKNLNEDYKKLCHSNSNYYMPFLTMNMESKNKSAFIINKLEHKKKNIKKELTSLLNVDTIGNKGTLLKLNKKSYRRLSFVNNLKKPSQNLIKNYENKNNKLPKITIIKEFKFATSQRNNNELKSLQSKFEPHIKKIKIIKSNANTSRTTNYNTRANSAIINDSKTQNLNFTDKLNNSDINTTNNNNFSKNKTKKKLFELRNLLLRKNSNLINNAIKNFYYSDRSNIKNYTKDLIIANQWKNKLEKLQKDFEKKLIKQRRDMHDLFPEPKDVGYFDMRKMKRYREDEKCEYIWMKKSTVNLLSFGNALNKMSEDEFNRNKGKIIREYPKLQRDAEIYVQNKYPNLGQNELLNQIEDNWKKISDMFYKNKLRIKKMKDEIKDNKANSALF